MNSAVTMCNGDVFQVFRVCADGTARMERNGKVNEIHDFAGLFINLCENGWKKASELEYEERKVKVKHKNERRAHHDRKGMLQQLSGFRTEWADYMLDNYENFEMC